MHDWLDSGSHYFFVLTLNGTTNHATKAKPIGSGSIMDEGAHYWILAQQQLRNFPVAFPDMVHFLFKEDPYHQSNGSAIGCVNR